MKISITTPYQTTCGALHEHIDGWCDGGQLEQLEKDNEETKKVIGRLLEFLITGGNISPLAAAKILKEDAKSAQIITE